MQVYIYLNEEDKNKLCKLGQSKQLSLSALVDIIANRYFYFFAYEDNNKNYINKGKKIIKLKIKESAGWHVSDKMATNCVYAYFHNEVIPPYPNKDYVKKVNRLVQSDMDKKYDSNYLKNLIIRTNYRINKGQIA